MKGINTPKVSEIRWRRSQGLKSNENRATRGLGRQARELRGNIDFSLDTVTKSCGAGLWVWLKRQPSILEALGLSHSIK